MAGFEIPDTWVKLVGVLFAAALLGYFGMIINRIPAMEQNQALIQQDVSQIKANGTEQSQQNREMIKECYALIKGLDDRLRSVERAVDKMESR